MSIPIYRPYVFLRCRKCSRKTDHVLVNAATHEKGEIEEIYECQECGEMKKIYEFADLHVHRPAQRSVKQRLEEPKKRPRPPKTPEILVPEVAEKIEKEQIEDSMEVTIEKKKRRIL